MNRPELLARIPLLQGLSDDARGSLAARLEERRLVAGEAVFAKGDRGEALFVVLSGRVSIFLPEAHGAARVELRELREGDYFGELALFDDKPRSASASARTDCVLLELRREHFVRDIVCNEGAVLGMLAEMAARLRDTNELLSQRTARDVVKEFEEQLSWKDRLADRVAELNGSWTFILGLVAIGLCWAFANSMMRRPFDAYPYQFFNLFLGFLVGLQGPLILMSQNRQAAKDRAQASVDFRVNLKNELAIESLVRDLAALRRQLLDLPKSVAGGSGEKIHSKSGRL